MKHHKKKIKDEIEAKKAAPPAGEWKGWKDRTTGKNKYIWVVKTKENKAKRQREGVEAAVDERLESARKREGRPDWRGVCVCVCVVCGELCENEKKQGPEP